MHPIQDFVEKQLSNAQDGRANLLSRATAVSSTSAAILSLVAGGVLLGAESNAAITEYSGVLRGAVVLLGIALVLSLVALFPSDVGTIEPDTLEGNAAFVTEATALDHDLVTDIVETMVHQYRIVEEGNGWISAIVGLASLALVSGTFCLSVLVFLLI